STRTPMMSAAKPSTRAAVPATLHDGPATRDAMAATLGRGATTIGASTSAVTRAAAQSQRFGTESHREDRSAFSEGSAVLRFPRRAHAFTSWPDHAVVRSRPKLDEPPSGGVQPLATGVGARSVAG